MAGLLSKGVSYFPMDTKLDLKFKLLKAKYKLQGIGFVDMLYRTIYGEGYYIHIDADKQIMLADEFGISENEFLEMLNFCIEKNFFEKKLYQKYQILTSAGIQKRYFKAAKRHSEIPVNKKYIIVNNLPENVCKEGEIATHKRRIRKGKEKDKDMVTKWNTFAGDHDLAMILKISGKRQSSINARLTENEFDFDKILSEIKNSDFLLGKKEGATWKVDFDFIFLSTHNYLKILEGKYRDNPEQTIKVSGL